MRPEAPTPVTLERLQREAPAWAWKASREGSGWSFTGSIGPWQVHVYLGATGWHVENGEGYIDAYDAWWPQHGR